MTNPATIPNANVTHTFAVGGVKPINPLKLDTNKKIHSNNTNGATSFQRLPSVSLHILLVQLTSISASNKIPLVGLVGSCRFNLMPTMTIKVMMITVTARMAKFGALYISRILSINVSTNFLFLSSKREDNHYFDCQNAK